MFAAHVAAKTLGGALALGRAAARAQGRDCTYWLRVNSQTNNQLLAVAIQVTTAAGQ
jgi:hypothetical protein